MLFRPATVEAIRAGRVTLAFRTWDRPRVRAGTRHRVGGGVVEIVSVAEQTGPLTEADARAAGFESLQALHAAQRDRDGARLYRIALRWGGEDPRAALREDADPRALAALAARLDAIDARSRRGPWAWAILELVARRPETRAADLAAELGRETLPFKADVRRLKELGLTESLEVGYRISPRGRALLRARGGA